MALTSNKDLIALTEEVKALKAKVDNLEQVLCEGRVLEEADASWEIVRNKRDYLLSSSDWTMTPGATLDQAQWSAYRQILRDIPQTYSKAGPEGVVWPKQPSFAGPNTAPVK
jgi:hypothetical protein